MATVILDAGHGGWDFGATYDGRVEKREVLDLTLEIGERLNRAGVNVLYTRVSDIYEAPIQKANEANRSGADYFISIHRNSSPIPNQYSGVETLVYNTEGRAAGMAANINAELTKIGFDNLGVNPRKDLVVLNKTTMPALLVEVGFINTAADNYLFDTFFGETAQAIADGIIMSL